MSPGKAYKSRETAILAAGKKSLFADLNGKFSHFDVIAIDGDYYVVRAGNYPAHQFWIIVRQYVSGYSI